MKAYEKPIFWTYFFTALFPVVLYIFPDLASDFFSKGIMSFIADIPYFGFLSVAFLGYRLNQTRILFSSIFMLASYIVLQHLHTGELKLTWISNDALIKIMAIAVPLAILSILAQKENRLKDWRSLLRLAGAFVPVLLLLSLSRWAPDSFKSLVEYQLVDFDWIKIPHLSVLAYAVVISGLNWIKDQKIGHYFISIIVAMFPCLMAFQMAFLGDANSKYIMVNTVLSYSIVAGILVDSMFRMYWQRVYLDELTGVRNRRALDEYLYTLDGEYTIAMIDIDHFKNFNDAYGHDEGDNVLRLVAATLDMQAKSRVFRYGGEEFCAVFEGASSEDSYMIANKMRRKVNEQDFHLRDQNADNVKGNILNFHFATKRLRYTSIKLMEAKAKAVSKKAGGKASPVAVSSQEPKAAPKKKTIKISVSIGLAHPTSPSQDPFEVIKHADKALYQAKKSGRNCVVIADRQDGLSVKKTS